MKNTNILKISLSAFSLLSLLLIAGSSVMLLNPIVENESSNITSGRVAGVSVSQVNREEVPLDINVSNSISTIFTKSSVINPASDLLLNTLISFNDLKAGKLSEDYVSIYNPNPIEVKTKVKFLIPENLKGKVKFYLEDNKDLIVLYSIEESYGPKTITLAPFETRSFALKTEVLQDVNFKSEVAISFTEGF